VIRQKPLPAALLQESSVDDRLLRAYREAVRKYAGKSWVTGITVSRKETDGKLARGTERVIAIHVRHKRRLTKASTVRIPSTILDVPTDVIHGDYQRSTNGASGVISGLAPGASISCTRGTAGTMGAIVRQAGDRCLLTAAHVLRECGKCKKGAEILHPGRADAATGTPATVARLADVHFGLDSGIATLSPGTTAQNVALVSGVRITSPVVPKIDDVLEKSGRTTGVTRARVQGIGTFEGVFPAIHLRPLLGGLGTVISGPGDSGAVWYLASGGAAIGLHVAGGVTDDNTYAVAAVLTEVMTELDLVWT
jgi:endonuclease G